MPVFSAPIHGRWTSMFITKTDLIKAGATGLGEWEFPFDTRVTDDPKAPRLNDLLLRGFVIEYMKDCVQDGISPDARRRLPHEYIVSKRISGSL